MDLFIKLMKLESCIRYNWKELLPNNWVLCNHPTIEKIFQWYFLNQILKFIWLIPKVDSPTQLGYFRSIRLVGSLYRLVAKAWVARIESVMDKIIFPNQFVFWKGRLLIDRVVAVNKLVDMAKKAKKECFIFKAPPQSPIIGKPKLYWLYD